MDIMIEMLLYIAILQLIYLFEILKYDQKVFIHLIV